MDSFSFLKIVSMIMDRQLRLRGGMGEWGSGEVFFTKMCEPKNKNKSATEIMLGRKKKCKVKRLKPTSAKFATQSTRSIGSGQR